MEGDDEHVVRARLRAARDSILGYRCDPTTENGLRQQLAVILEPFGWRREARLYGRDGEAIGYVDFFHDVLALAVEIKVAGSPSAVAEQLVRYADSPMVNGLLLVTARAALGRGMPPTICGKPFETCELWRTAL